MRNIMIFFLALIAKLSILNCTFRPQRALIAKFIPKRFHSTPMMTTSDIAKKIPELLNAEFNDKYYCFRHLVGAAACSVSRVF